MEYLTQREKASRKYYLKNKCKVLKYNLKYKEDNKEELKVKRKEAYKKHIEYMNTFCLADI